MIPVRPCARWALWLALLPGLATALEPILSAADRFHPTEGRGGMVVAQEALAARAGAEILAAGGNAVDAAVATGFALAVTFPQAGNLGGGGFMVLRLADGRAVALDYRETAPAAAHRDLFRDAEGRVDPALSRDSALAVAVPGTVAGLIHAQRRYGRLPLARVMAPAIALARDGFLVSEQLAWSLSRAAERLARHPASRRYFLGPRGEPPRPGTLWRQPDLAATLERIAKSGGRDFYQGRTARLIAAEMARAGGILTAADLAAYRVRERPVLEGEYRGYRILTMPPPSSGGVHLLQMLNILAGWDLRALGHNGADHLHRLAEAMRRAYADRSRYLGDPDFVAVPVARLLDPAYAARLRAGIDLTRATPSSSVAPGLEPAPESPDTTHFAVWDEAGNVVSNTYTLNFSYGSGISVAGAGFLLNNEMDDFAAAPGVPNAYGLVGGEANAVAGGKRPLSSMTPVILLRDGEPILATGSPGGSRIITTVLQLLSNVVDFGMNLAEATAAPRIHHQWLPDVLEVEEGISPDTVARLAAMGHRVETAATTLGKVQSIAREGERFLGVSDYRWPGGAALSPSHLEAGCAAAP